MDLSEFHRGFIPLYEGRLSYLHRPGSGPALVLIPGSYHPASQWSEVVARLDPRLHVVLVETRGSGESWPVPEDGSIEMFAVDVLRVVDELHLSRFYVGGHSIGGMIAIEVAELRPENVQGVISIEGWTNAQAAQDAFAGDMVSTLTPELEARRLQERKQALARWNEDQAKRFAQIWRHWDGSRILSTTKVPILEVWGDRGRPRPSLDRLHIPERKNIQVLWLANASHWLPLERPQELAQAINDFIFQSAPLLRSGAGRLQNSRTRARFAGAAPSPNTPIYPFPRPTAVGAGLGGPSPQRPAGRWGKCPRGGGNSPERELHRLREQTRPPLSLVWG